MIRTRSVATWIALGCASCALDEAGSGTPSTTDAGLDAAIDATAFDADRPGTDASTEAEASGPCGAYGQVCCAVGPPCSAGACLAGTCAEFGGAYELSLAPECSATPCHDENPHAALACACPGGFLAQKILVSNDCFAAGVQTLAELTFCHASAVYAGSDFAGAFAQLPPQAPCAPPGGCQTPNPYTGTCSCPVGAIGIQFPLQLPVCDNTSYFDGVLSVCWNPGAPRASFDGAYLVDDIAPFCAVARPGNMQCACPNPAGSNPLRVLRKVNNGLRGALLYTCSPEG